MRKRTWLVVILLAAVLAVTFGASTVFAQGPAVSDGEAWEEMHQACENGDYEAMAEWHAEYHCAEDPMNEGMAGSGMMGMMGMMGGLY